MTEIPSLIELAINSGFSAIIFVIWYISFKSSSAALVSLTTGFKESTEALTMQSQKAYEDAIKANQQHSTDLKEIIKEGHELHVLLVRNLQRIEDKLDQPVRCPYQVADRRPADKQKGGVA